MPPDALRTHEHLSTRNVAIAMGVSVLSTTAVLTYALVKDSGATVADLGRDVWRGTKPHIKDAPEKIAKSLKEGVGTVVELCKEEYEMFDSTILRNIRGGNR